MNCTYISSYGRGETAYIVPFEFTSAEKKVAGFLFVLPQILNQRPQVVRNVWLTLYAF